MLVNGLVLDAKGILLLIQGEGRVSLAQGF